MTTDPVVQHRPDLREYHLVESGTVVSTVGYDRGHGTVVLVYTVTPEEFRHRGHAGRLVGHVLDQLAGEPVRVVVRCPFARRWQAERGTRPDGVA